MRPGAVGPFLRAGFPASRHVLRVPQLAVSTIHAYICALFPATLGKRAHSSFFKRLGANYTEGVSAVQLKELD